MPWNAIDKKGRCAGEYAQERGNRDAAQALLQAGEKEMLEGLTAFDMYRINHAAHKGSQCLLDGTTFLRCTHLFLHITMIKTQFLVCPMRCNFGQATCIFAKETVGQGLGV